MSLGNDHAHPAARCHDRNRFYKYVTAEVAKAILTTRRLRWSSPLLFDDSLDVSQDLRLNFDEAHLHATCNDRIASLIEHGDTTNSVKHPQVAALLHLFTLVPSDARRAIAAELRQTPSTPTSGLFQALAEIKNTWKQMVPTFRILCLSERNDLTDMWANYAGKSGGVVLEYSPADLADTCFLIARRVVYQHAPPAIDADTWTSCMLGQDGSTYETLFTEYMYVKTAKWAYQKEWRIVDVARSSETGLYTDSLFHPRELTGIFLGPQCSPTARADLLSLLKDGLEHVRPYEAVSDAPNARFTFRPLAC